MNPRAYRYFLPSFLVFYCVAGFMTHSRLGGRQIFPFFSWSLYSEATPIVVQYTALLHEVEGRVHVPPLELMSTPAFHRAPDYWRDIGVVEAFGAALDAGNGARAAIHRRQVEANVLLGSRIRYEMVRRTYDPRERRLSGAFEETSLGMFTKDGAAGAQR